MLSDLALDLFFLRGFNDFSIVVHKASHGVLFSDLFDLAGKLFDEGSGLVHTSSKLFTPSILLLKQLSIIFHRLILPITFPKHIKTLSSIGKVLHRALNWPRYHLLHLLYLTRQPFVFICLVSSSLLVHFEI